MTHPCLRMNRSIMGAVGARVGIGLRPGLPSSFGSKVRLRLSIRVGIRGWGWGWVAVEVGVGDGVGVGVVLRFGSGRRG